MEIPVGAYREVFLEQAFPGLWKEITVDTGATQTTLQDIRATDLAGAYAYKNKDHPATKNRFIYWRTSYDCLELIELSLNTPLAGNQLRYRFTNTPLLSGLTVHETSDELIVLVVTISSVHRLSFAHPVLKYTQNRYGEMSPSAFLYASIASAKDRNSFHLINRPHNAAMPTCGASWLGCGGQMAAFALSGGTDAVTVVRLYVNGRVCEEQLKEHGTLLPRFFLSLTRVISGKRETVPTADMVLFNCDNQTVLVCVGADGSLRHANVELARDIAHIHELVTAPVDGPGFQPHMIRQCTGPNGKPLLVVHLCFATYSTFYLLEAVVTPKATVEFVVAATIPATDFVTAQMDLVDVCVTDGKLVGAWRGPDNSSFVAATTRLGNQCDWMAAQLEEVTLLIDDPVEHELPVSDPQLLYSEQIFAPGRFTIPVLTRAINVFQQSACAVSSSMSLCTLSRAACLAVQTEATRGLPNDVTDEEILENAHASWAALRSCVLQCHLVGDRPAAVAALESGLLLVKKDRVSLLRKMYPIEAPTVKDSLPNILRDLSALISEESWQLFEVQGEDAASQYQPNVPADCRLYGSDENPNSVALKPQEVEVWSQFKIAATLANHLLESEDTVLAHVEDLVERVTRLPSWPKPLKELLFMLDPTMEEQRAEPLNMVTLASQLGNSVVAVTLQQVIGIRLRMCRSLLLLKSLLKSGINPRAASLEKEMMKVEGLAQMYAALKWLCNKTAQRGTISMAELLVNRLPDRERSGSDLLGRVRQMLSVLWPHGHSAKVGEYLLGADELDALISWEELIAPWCGENIGRRHAQIGAAWVRMNRPGYAVRYFISASNYVDSEPEILATVECRVTPPDRAMPRYYLKVMDLLDKHGHRKETGDLARSALSKMLLDDPMVPIFHSRLFSRAMALARYDQAFAAVQSNPDPDRRVDSLRELVFTLVRTRQLDVLFTFKYNDLFPAVVRILERSARAAEPTLQGVYGVLYAFHVRRSKYRKAASYTYEAMFRIDRETVPSLKTLREQRNCLAFCITSLHLVEPKYQWLGSQEYNKAIPDNEDEERRKEEERNQGSTLTVHGMLQSELDAQPFLVTAVGLKDLKRRLTMVKARIRLFVKRPKEYGDHIQDKTWNPSEMVAMLTHARFFCDALDIAHQFDLPYVRPLEGLASANMELQRKPDSDPWEWLQNNFTPETGDVEMTASNTAWRLLEVLLLRYEKPGLSELHNAVAWRLMQDAFEPPQYMVAYLSMNNPAQLLRLYLRAGWLEKAAEYAQKYVTSVTYGYPDFGMSEKLGSGRPTCLPWRTLQTLIVELDRPGFEEHHGAIDEAINRYLEIAQRMAQESSVGLVT